MGNDGESKKGIGIPSWQRIENEGGGSGDGGTESAVLKEGLSEEPASDNGEYPLGSSQLSLLEQARLFLQDESIQRAPPDQKIAFLESKGISKGDAERAIQDIKDKATHPVSNQDLAEAPASNTQASSTPPSAVSARDVPPIIAYPEFLMQAQKPAPLITIQRLFQVAWAAAGVATAVYGTSKYVITPMSDNLTEARHDFSRHVQDHLDNLNSKLKVVVSTDPGHKSHNAAFRTVATPEAFDAVSDAGTVDSDPTELFHRDYGTQTSPVIGAADDKSGYESSSNNSEDGTQASVEAQTSKLKQLGKLCEGLNADSAGEGSTSKDISTTIRVLREHLESLMYTATNQTYGYYGAGGGGAAALDKKKDDEVVRMKAEIRSIKGLMLSAKNFPGARSGTFSAPS